MFRIACTRSFVVACLAASILFTGACGYRNMLATGDAGGRGAAATPPPDDGREILESSVDRPDPSTRPTRLAVIALENDSPEPWLDRIVTESMRREVAARGGFELVNDPSEAELVIRGRVRPIDNRAESYSSFVAAVEFAITLALDLEVVRRGGDIVRLDTEMLSETDVYLASGDIEVTRTNRLELLRHLSDLLAARVADSLEVIRRPLASRAAGAGG